MASEATAGPIPVTVHGAEGRMGRLVTALVESAPDMRLAALITEPGRGQDAGAFHPRLALVGQDELAAVHPVGGVVVDFSLAPALAGLLRQGARCGAALVTGTTGFSADEETALGDYAARHPVVRAANFSIGIPALKLVLRLLARTLPREFAAEQVETHHVHKRDRPSGTARWLAEAWQTERGAEVPVHSLRLGEIVGEHAWIVSDAEETLQLTHRAHSRRAFLRGVLPAIRFAHGRSPGLYGLTDVLNDLADPGGASSRSP
jgi:4-hydroxy-tetrahydrodipicolinate reductase